LLIAYKILFNVFRILTPCTYRIIEVIGVDFEVIDQLEIWLDTGKKSGSKIGVYVRWLYASVKHLIQLGYNYFTTSIYEFKRLQAFSVMEVVITREPTKNYTTHSKANVILMSEIMKCTPSRVMEVAKLRYKFNLAMKVGRFGHALIPSQLAERMFNFQHDFANVIQTVHYKIYLRSIQLVHRDCLCLSLY
jgi:hypothetical protein